MLVMWHFRQSQFPYTFPQSLRQTYSLGESTAPQVKQLSKLPPSRHTKNSRSLYLYLDFELKLGKSKEFDNQGMKAQVKRAFKSYSIFITKKSSKKVGRLCVKVLSRCPNTLFQSQYPFILLPSLFQKIYQPPGRDQENGKQEQCRLPPQSFRINLKDTSSHISIDPLGLYLSPFYVVSLINYSEAFISHFLGEVFKVFIKFRLLENTFASQKTGSRHFYSCRPRHFYSCRPRQKSPPGFLS